jgi:hypothetical protein
MRVGERIELHEVHRNNGWEKFRYGTVIGYAPGRPGVASRDEDGSWKVRFDEYEYTSESDHHYVGTAAMDSIETDAVELNEVLASIGQAARNTMSTRRLP